ncbi:MAG: dienelactone hydrolase family protein [Pseudomonadota bacterium]|nr:dienelactone hydrolase family protein [Pseudomonadota bacterium]
MSISINTRTLSYTAPDGTTLHSYLALPADTNQQVAAVVVTPEWWGLTDYPMRRADALAEQGYAALAIDVYGDGKTTTAAAQANEWMMQMLNSQDLLMQRAQAGLDQLIKLPEIDENRIAAIGYCFGGKIALDMAREGMPLKAVASFHGELSPKAPAEVGKMTAAVLIEHGVADSMISMEALEGFKAEMAAAQVDVTVHLHKDAKHGFTNPAADQRAVENGVDLGYNAEADQASWQSLLDFLSQKIG